jgi:hypothetical protein
MKAFLRLFGQIGLCVLIFASAASAQEIRKESTGGPNQVLAPAGALTAPSVPAKPKKAEIYFTGGLFGYFRLPNTQSIAMDHAMISGAAKQDGGDPLKDFHCPLPGEQAPSVDAEVFFAANRWRPKGSLLLGTGDNFSPNYYSRAFEKPEIDRVAEGVPGVAIKPESQNHYEKELYGWDWKENTWIYSNRDHEDKRIPSDLSKIDRLGRGTIPTDNVGCFLSYAGYAAVVPGKHDFHYGPERLRELARFMASINQGGHFSRVQMLGANMVVKTTWETDHKPIPGNFVEKVKLEQRFVKTYTPKLWAGVTTCTPDDEAKCDVKIEDFTDNHFVYPWLRQVSVTLTGISAEKVRDGIQFKFCTADPGDPDRFMVPNNSPAPSCIPADLVAEPEYRTANRNYKALGPSTKQKLEPQWVLKVPPELTLTGGQNYAVCAAAKPGRGDPKNQPVPYCVQFSVFTPFFEFAKEPDPASTNQKGHDFKNPDRYVYRKLLDGTEVVVFGIVDQDLMSYVGGTNRAWEVTKDDTNHLNRKYKTEIAIADPAKALEQLQDLFEEEYLDCTGHEFRGIRILLAQMTPTQARDFASLLPQSLRFDVVITEANDQLATPNEHVTINSSTDFSLSNNISRKPPTLIVVPPVHDLTAKTSAGINRWVQIRQLEVTVNSRRGWDFDLTGKAKYVPVEKSESSAESEFWMDVQKAFYKKFCKSPNAAESLCAIGPEKSFGILKPKDQELVKQQGPAALQQLALEAVRSRHHADIALLQERDIYADALTDFMSEHCAGSSGAQKCKEKIDTNLQQIMDRFLWKGDFIRELSVTGSVLKKVMDQSKKFDDDDKSGYVLVPERGRGLIPLGIKRDPDSEEYIVNGAPLDTGALYTVAASDYISLGDTGYPDLAPPPGDLPASPFDTENLRSIGSATCAVVDQKPVSEKSSRCSADIYFGPEYYDAFSEMQPDDVRKGQTKWERLVLWSGIHPNLVSPPDRSEKKSKDEKLQPGPFTENVIQERPRWELNFDELNIGFSDLSHNGDETTLGNTFGGVLDSQVTAKHSRTLNWGVDGKLTNAHSRFDLFISPSLNYSSTVTAQASGPASETQSANLFAIDFGAYLHFRDRQELPNLYLAMYGHFETQVADPITSLKISIPNVTNPPALTFKQGQTNLLLERSGLRWQNRKSFVEAGLEGGATLNSISQFDIHDPTTGAIVLSCFETSVSLQNCVNTFNKTASSPINSTFDVTSERHLLGRYGVYWNIGLTVPISTNISYNFVETSDFFFNSSGDNSANTKFRHQIVQSVEFFVLPSLSFQPTLTFYLYENKVNYDFLFQRQYVVKINYSFDWTNLHQARQQFKYKRPSSQ